MNTRIQSSALTETKVAKKVQVAIAKGDGIGPEIMDAVLQILVAAGANIAPVFIELGEKVYESGNSSGIGVHTWDAIRESNIILKAPITTPQGKGYKSLNVTLRKSLGLYANVRPVVSLYPYVKTNFPKLGVVIIRENEEDLYAGIEHQQTQDVVQCLKLITRPGCEKIVRYAFEYAKIHGRKKVTCMVKDNIMKLTDGLFHQVFKEIALEYPAINSESQIIDIGAARLAANPEAYDVVVTSNLYGDIISDIVAEVAGSVGMAGSANIGAKVAMFEAIHGSTPDIAGKDIANPSGLLNAAIAMLVHIGQTQIANTIKNAWLVTLEDGLHTADIFNEATSTKKVGTAAFAKEIIARLDKKPTNLPCSTLDSVIGKITIPEYRRKQQKKVLVGVDIFIDWKGTNPDEIGERLEELKSERLKLKMITNRGVKVYPRGIKETYCTDHWRCRFVAVASKINTETLVFSSVAFHHVLELQAVLSSNGFDLIKTENLYEFDGRRAFSLGQGE